MRGGGDTLRDRELKTRHPPREGCRVSFQYFAITSSPNRFTQSIFDWSVIVSGS